MKGRFYENKTEAVMDFETFRGLNPKAIHKTLEEKAKLRKQRKTANKK
jgi:hypothetical protein